jgi:hypothetical protein
MKEYRDPHVELRSPQDDNSDEKKELSVFSLKLPRLVVDYLFIFVGIYLSYLLGFPGPYKQKLGSAG